MIKLEMAPTALLASLGMLMVALVTILVHDSDEEKQPIVQSNLTQPVSPHPIAVQQPQDWRTQAPALMNNTERHYPPLEYSPDRHKQTVIPSPQPPRWVPHDELVNSTYSSATTQTPATVTNPDLLHWSDSVYYAPTPQEQPREVQPHTSSNSSYYPDKRAYGERPRDIELYAPRTGTSAYRPHLDSPSRSPSSRYPYAPPQASLDRYPPTPQHMPPSAQRGYTNGGSLGTYQPFTPQQPSAPSPFYSGPPYYRSR